MPRYGDLDALEKKLFPMGMVDDGRYALPAKAVKVAIDSLPTADVVPRTVIAEIFAEFGKFCCTNEHDYEEFCDLKKKYGVD